MMVHFLWKVGDWFPKWKGDASFAVMYVICGRMCSSYDGSTGKLLTGHFLRDGSRLRDDVPGQ